jgi:hypothetical protein
MGILNNASITVDAILTKKGRELLAKGQNQFNITQFALGDDEIDYTLWNPDHPLGTAYYGATIEALPLIEALPDETQMMKFKLVTLPQNANRIPQISVGQSAITLTPGDFVTISPNTTNFSDGNATLGYTLILSDNTVCAIDVIDQAPGAGGGTVPTFIGDNEAAQSVAITGMTFKVTGANLPSTKSATIIVIGNETGGRQTINVTVKGVQLYTQQGTPLV